MCAPAFIAALFTIVKMWKQPECPSVDEWIKKLLYIYTGTLLGCKKEGNLTFVTARMDLEIIVFSEISQSEKDKYHMIRLINGI